MLNYLKLLEVFSLLSEDREFMLGESIVPKGKKIVNEVGMKSN